MYQLRRLRNSLYNTLAKLLQTFGLYDRCYLSALEKLADDGSTIEILILCQGNICRSPYAEALLRAELKEAKYQISSAGLDTHTGKTADSNAIRIAESRGISLAAHRTTLYSTPDLQRVDLIVGMEPHHLRAVSKIDSSLSEKTLLLGACSTQADRGLIISDPYGLPDSHFVDCFSQIEHSVSGLIARLEKGTASS